MRKASTAAQSPSEGPRRRWGGVVQVLQCRVLKFRVCGEVSHPPAELELMLRMPSARSAHTPWTGTWTPISKPVRSVCIWKRNSLCSLTQWLPGECAGCSRVPGKPSSKVVPKVCTHPQNTSQEKAQPHFVLFLGDRAQGPAPPPLPWPPASPTSVTFAAASWVSAFCPQAVSWCLPFPQLGTPSPSACQPTPTPTSANPVNLRRSLLCTSFHLCLLHLDDEAPFYLLLTLG